jgi:hypothetical protein
VPKSKTIVVQITNIFRDIFYYLSVITVTDTIGVRRTCEQCRETSFSRRKCRKTIREMPGIFGRMRESWLRRRRARVCIDNNQGRHFEQFL